MNGEQHKSLHAFRREIKITRTFSLHLFVIHSGRAAAPPCLALDTPRQAALLGAAQVCGK